MSIQQIQEEERQLQEAIEKSKQDAENLALSEPISPTFHGRSSPQVAPIKQESDPFVNVLKVIRLKRISAWKMTKFVYLDACM